jgi:aspartate-semialdehyde dehydrogenase
MKKVYLAGAGGMLGEAFHSILKDDFELKCTDIDLNEYWLEYLDFRDWILAHFDEPNPQEIIHLRRTDRISIHFIRRSIRDHEHFRFKLVFIHRIYVDGHLCVS